MSDNSPHILADQTVFLNSEKDWPTQLLLEALDKRKALARPCWEKYNELIERLPPLAEVLQFQTQDGVVHIGDESQIDADTHQTVEALIEELIPWRKGPFNLLGHEIDCEWRSDMKWDRVRPHLDCLKGMRVADVGCGNGYYMYRMMELQPEYVLGFDPSEKFFQTFRFLQHFSQESRLQLEMLGAEHLKLLPGWFNCVFCMGVIYHQRNPLGLLTDLYNSLCYRGLLVLESIVIPGEADTCLFPKKRYGKARNVYFLPTVSCLESWLDRAGFSEIETVFHGKTETSEQRSTKFAPYESLSDFLDPQDHSKTIEGYPAPERALVLARKKSRN